MTTEQTDKSAARPTQQAATAWQAPENTPARHAEAPAEAGVTSNTHPTQQAATAWQATVNTTPRHAEAPAEAGPTFAVAEIVAEERADLDTLDNWIACANEADARRGKAAEILRAAGRVHLAWCCIMGACVQHVYTLAAAEGEGIKTLFKDGYDRRSKMARAAGGACFNFCYAQGNKYRQLYLGIHARMIAEGGMTPELLQATINDHVRAFMAGAWGDRESLAFFGPYLSADSLRAELAALFPREPKKVQTAAEAVEDSLAGLPASYDNRRAKMATEWSGYLETMDTFIEAYIPLSTPSEREAKAVAFDNMARRLREANNPQPLGF